MWKSRGGWSWVFFYAQVSGLDTGKIASFHNRPCEGEQKALGIFQNGYISPLSAGSARELFCDLHNKNLIRQNVEAPLRLVLFGVFNFRASLH